MQQKTIKEEEDFYYNEQGYKVFTETFHLKRGYCCKNGCKHCAYGYDKKTDTFKKTASQEAKDPDGEQVVISNSKF